MGTLEMQYIGRVFRWEFLETRQLWGLPGRELRLSQTFCLDGKLDKISGHRGKKTERGMDVEDQKDSTTHPSFPGEAVGNRHVLGWLNAYNPLALRKAPDTHRWALAAPLDQQDTNSPFPSLIGPEELS